VTVLKPDAFLALGSGAFELLAYIEVDMGTESPATLAAKLDTYRRFWQSGGAEQTGGVMPLVVWVVPDQARLDVLHSVIERQPSDARRLHLPVLRKGVVDRLSRPSAVNFTAKSALHDDATHETIEVPTNEERRSAWPDN
jgi:hypothetical protein